MAQVCSNIVECLRQIGVEPEASASSEADSNKLAKYALVYNSDNQFHTRSSEDPQWWIVDFKRIVSISSYLIQTGDWCYFIYSWNASVSKNNRTWTRIDSQKGYPLGKTFQLNMPYNARFFRVEGSTPQCSKNNATFAYTFIKFFGLIKGSYEGTCRYQKSHFDYLSPFSIYLK